MGKTSLIQPRPSEKMDAIFNALEDGWPNAKRNRHIADTYILWGLIGNNQNIIRSGLKYVFVDMPYNGRFRHGTDILDSYWRVCPMGLHNTTKFDVTSERFESWGVELKPYEERDFILICPSSETMTRFMHGCSVNEWVASVKRVIAYYTNRPVRVRLKPRKAGTSGPAVADIPIENDLMGCHAVVSSASLCAIDALKEGVQVFSTNSLNPAAWEAQTDFSKINTLTTQDKRLELFSNLAWKQYSIEEMRTGFCYENISRLFNNQGV